MYTHFCHCPQNIFQTLACCVVWGGRESWAPREGKWCAVCLGQLFQGICNFHDEKSFRAQKNSNKEKGWYGIMNEAVIKTNMSNFLVLPEVIHTDKQAMRLSSTLTKRDTICVWFTRATAVPCLNKLVHNRKLLTKPLYKITGSAFSVSTVLPSFSV